MREELIRVLNAKLDDINNNIDSLVELNNKIDGENDKLTYTKKILDIFKNGEDYDILKFVELKKDDFEKVLAIVENDAEKIFNTDSCNYDGLVYLIKGINNGVSLTLTEEQKSGIEYLIRGLNEKKEEYEAIIDGLILVKTRFEIDDIDILTNKKNEYSHTINKINANDYVDETDKIIEAMDFSHLTNDEKVKVLTFVLEYNAGVYKEKGNSKIEEAVKTYDDMVVEEPIEATEISPVEEVEKFTFKPFEMQDISENAQEVSKKDTFENQETSDVVTFEENNSNTSQDAKIYQYAETENEKVPEENEISFEEPSTFETSRVEEPAETMEEVIPQDSTSLETNNFEEFSFSQEEHENLNTTHQVEETPVTDTIDQDFAGIVTSNDDYEQDKIDETTSTRELQRLFGEFGLTNIEISERLLSGNANNYRKVIETLKRNDLLDRFASNKELMQSVMLNTGEEEIESVLKIIKDELSIDDDDYKVTVKIAVDTLPTIFIKDSGNYDNFVNNIRLFKNLGIDLISLFDFSKEVFIVDNEFALNNYNTVKNYNVEIDYKNAKYMLMLPNVAEKMDYYVESVYEDKTKGNEKFDGINYINNYAVKLNSVCDLTIKRLRYASETGNKVFGSKPNSLTGEITNLKVNALEIGDEYLNKFFNNEFDGISSEETREFTKLIHNSSNVGNYSDELEIIEKYHNGLRYVIEGINISYNKTVRIYNILRSYGINNNKALHFALCYNLVITKEEYDKLKGIIEELGGNA